MGIVPEMVETSDGVCPLSDDDVINIIINFGCLISGKEIYKYQSRAAYRIVESVIHNEGALITAQFSRQSGKSTIVGIVIAALMVLMPIFASMYPNDSRFVLKNKQNGTILGYATGFAIGCFAPKQEQAAIIFSNIKDIFALDATVQILKALNLRLSTSNGKYCTLNSGSFVKACTANEGASIEGDSFHLIVTDETQDIADMMLSKSISPMGASTNATRVEIGTSGIGKCKFYKDIRQNRLNYSLGARKRHFEVHWKEAAKENSYYATYVEGMKQEIGEDSDEFKMSFCNTWLLERGHFCTDIMVDELLDDNREFGDFFKAGKNARKSKLSCVAAIDFGKDHDRTVLSIGVVDFNNPIYEEEVITEEEWKIVTDFACDLVDWEFFDGDDYETQFHVLVARLKSLPFPLKRIALDGTGCGSAIVDRFRVNFTECDILDMKFTPQSKDIIFRDFLRAIRGGFYRVPAGPETKESRAYKLWRMEMLDLEKSYSQGLMMVAAPDLSGAHDDFPVSSALLYQAAKERPTSGAIEVSNNNMFRGR